MEVVNENGALLSNSEVYQLLTDIQQGKNGQKKPSKHTNHLATISYSTLKYLERTPCKDQTPDTVHKFLQALAPYNLKRAEKLQLLNNRPSSAVEIQLLIEESEERLSEQQIEELLQLIAEMLPGEPAAAAGIAEETQEEVEQSWQTSHHEPFRFCNLCRNS